MLYAQKGMIIMGKLKIGAMVESFRCGIRGGIEKAAALGAEGVQMYATDGELAPENMTAEKISEVRDMIKSNGLVISAICGDLGKGYCTACFDGDYPTEVPTETHKSKFECKISERQKEKK